jgi:phytoene dehydrogenase-like protein
VIGAGAAGIAAARELLREGHSVTVLEQNSRLGGVWVFDERVEKDDLLGQTSKRQRVR